MTVHDFLGKTKAELLELLDEARAAGDKIRGRLIHDHLVSSHGWSAAHDVARAEVADAPDEVVDSPGQETAVPEAPTAVPETPVVEPEKAVPAPAPEKTSK